MWTKTSLNSVTVALPGGGNDEPSSSSSSSSGSILITGTTSGFEPPCVEPLHCKLPHGLRCQCSETSNGTNAFVLGIGGDTLNETHYVRFGSALSNVAVDITVDDSDRNDTSTTFFVTGTYHVGRGGAVFAPLRGLGDRPDWVMTPTPYLSADATERYKRATQEMLRRNDGRTLIYNETEIPIGADIFLARFVEDTSSAPASSSLRMTYLIGLGSPAVDAAATVRVHNEYVYVVGHSTAVETLQYGFTPGEFKRDIAWHVVGGSLPFTRDPACDALDNDNIPLRPTRLDPSEHAYGNFDILVSVFLKGSDNDECGGALQRSVLFGTSGNDRAVSAAVGTFAGGDFCDPPDGNSRGMGCLVVVGYTDDPFVSCRSTDRLSSSQSCNDGAVSNYNTFVAMVRMWDIQRPVVFLEAFGGASSDEYPLASVVRRLHGTSQTLIISGLSNGPMADCLETNDPSRRKCGKYDTTLLAFDMSDIIDHHGSIEGHELVESAAFRYGYEGDDLSGGGLEVLVLDDDETRVFLAGAEAMSPIYCAEVGLSCANLAEEDVDSDLVLSVLSDLHCPRGRSPSTTSSGLFCDRCPIGTFSNGGDACETCPDGTTCRFEELVRDGGSMLSGSFEMEPVDGFYIFDLESRTTQECSVGHFGEQRCVASGCAAGLRSYDAYGLGDNSDGGGDISTWLCRVCALDEYALQSSGTCESCKSNSSHAVIIRFASFVLLFVLARYVVRYFRRQFLQVVVWIVSVFLLLADSLTRCGCGRFFAVASSWSSPSSSTTAVAVSSSSSTSSVPNSGDVESAGANIRSSRQRMADMGSAATAKSARNRRDHAVALVARMTGLSNLRHELTSGSSSIAHKKSKRESRRARRARAMSKAGTKRPESSVDSLHLDEARQGRQSARLWHKIHAKKRMQIRYAMFALVKTILFHSHLTNSIVEVYYVRWSLALRYVYSVFDFVNLHLAVLSGVSCYGFDLGFWGVLACAFGVPSLLWLTCATYECFSSCRENCFSQYVGQPKHRRLQMKARRRKQRRWFLANSILVPAWLFLYVPTSRIALRTFLCIPVDTEWRLDMDVRILCYDETYSNTVVVVGIAALALFVLGTPLYYYAVLRYKLVEVEIATNTADRKAAENYARLLYEEYRDYSPMRVPESENHNYYQCIFDCGRLLMLTTLPLLMFQHQEMQLYLGIALAMPIIFEHFYGVLTDTSALASPVVRYFRGYSLVLYSATLVSGLLLKQGRIDADGVDGALLETALLLANLGWIVGMVFTFAMTLEGFELDAWFLYTRRNQGEKEIADLDAEESTRRQGKATVRNRYTQKLYSENEEALKADSRVQRRKVVALGVEGRRAQRGNNKKQGTTNAPQVEADRIAKQLKLDSGSMGKLSEEVRQQKIGRDNLVNEIMHLKSDLAEIEARMQSASEKRSLWKKKRDGE
eukprot:g2449.t1